MNPSASHFNFDASRQQQQQQQQENPYVQQHQPDKSGYYVTSEHQQHHNPYASLSGYGMDQETGGYDTTGYGYAQGGGYGGAETYIDHQQWQVDPTVTLHDDATTSPEPGTYYEVPHLEVFSAPVSAVAYDTFFDAIYTSSCTMSLNTHHRSPRRASMRVTHTASTGQLYSSVASHPQAPASVLNALYARIYGSTSSSISARSGAVTIPPHAYQSPYGQCDPALPHVRTANATFQMGVTAMTPIYMPNDGDSTVASVSPAGVRIHAAGGLQLADHSMEGLMAGTAHPNSHPTNGMTHYTVGGMAAAADQHHQLHCLDIWQGLRVVSSHALGGGGDKPAVVTSLATSHSKRCVAAGATDGNVYLVDDRNRTLAKLKSHVGGVVDVAVSADGCLVATTGYGSSAAVRSPGTPPYGFCDPTVLVYDIRYLGRGGFPHPFSGVRGGPRFVAFCPNVEGLPSNRLLAVSGQVGGGCQLMVPFQDVSSGTATHHFIQPQLGHKEAVNCLCVSEDKLAMGTTQGRVLQYRLAGYDEGTLSSSGLGSGAPQGGIFIPTQAQSSTGKSSGSGSSATPKKPAEKHQLVLPPFEPVPPAVSLEASLLLKNDDPSVRMGGMVRDHRIKSIFGCYVLAGDPSVSSIGDPSQRSLTSFGPLATNPLVAQSKLQLSADLCSKARCKIDFIETIPVSEFGLNLFDDHRPSRIKDRDIKQSEPLANPNKFLYTNKLYKLSYGESFNRTKRYGRRSRRGEAKSTSGSDDSADEGEMMSVPHRYRLTLRPFHRAAASYNHGEYNHANVIPGFDYPMTMPNAFVPPVLLLLYFIPELKEAVLKSQLGRTLSKDHLGRTLSKDIGLMEELGYLFHRIESLTRNALLFPVEEGGGSALIRMDAFAPTSFISTLSTMPEAERFQILDGSPAAIESPRRPEAFYRFLLYQLGNEIEKGRSETGLIDSLSGADFVSINEFISGSGPPSKSTTRHLTVDMTYDYFFGAGYKSEGKPSFGDVLQYNLCSAKRLRAWSPGSKSYETIVQRKIVTCLPKILSLSAACAGRKEGDGLSLWKDSTGDNNLWLPEMVEIEILEDGSVIVRELVHSEKTGSDSWKECRGTGAIPSSISEVVKGSIHSGSPRKRRYRLDAVVSMIRDDYDRACPEEVRALNTEGSFGHHVLHVRVSAAMKKQIVQQQIAELKSFVSAHVVESITDMTLLGRAANLDVFQKRLDSAAIRLNETEDKVGSGEWVLVNGFVVSDTVVEDARAFHVKFKEPSLIVFRAVDEAESPKKEASKGKSRSGSDDSSSGVRIPPEVMRTKSITNATWSPYGQKLSDLPGKGDLVAFDAEFVAVAEEESTLTLTGSKVTIRETRHALARISLIDGRPGTCGDIVIDDHIQPNEEVVDYLTRFSGIVAQDLDPKLSQHHLISNRAAYLKLRCMVERGCIFVGHGLRQDFWIANLAVPANQIIDTVDIFHKPAQRHISLRFLTNFVLKRDMQQDVHDSVEDALAAFELYKEAVQLKKSGEFESTLNALYEFGQKNDWKLGVNDDDN